MAWSRAKTIIIVVLFAVNIFLLGTYLFRENEERNFEEELRQDTCTALAKQDIAVSKDIIPLDSVKIRSATLKYKEDISDIAAALFGEVEVFETPESVTYIGEKGNIMLSGGAISILFESGEQIESREKASELSEKIFSALGVSRAAMDIICQSSSAGFDVKITQSAGSVPVFDSPLELHISSNGSVLGSCRYLSSGGLRYTGEEVMTVSSVLFEFADVLRAKSADKVQVKGIELGYTSKKPGAGRVSLCPTLAVTTDGGVFYMDMTTGEEVIIN